MEKQGRVSDADGDSNGMIGRQLALHCIQYVVARLASLQHEEMKRVKGLRRKRGGVDV